MPAGFFAHDSTLERRCDTRRFKNRPHCDEGTSNRSPLVWKHLSCAVLSLLACTGSPAADLTATETRWLKGAWPVVTYARESHMPLDIVVQPQAMPGAAPLALAFVDGRCKLVLSMRGNPEAQATLDRVEPDLLDTTLELMAAHELGHCRRYLDGAWYDVPAGFAASVPAELDPELRAAFADMQATRREEAYGDLVGLAWTQVHHPKQYARMSDWLVQERSKDLVPGSHHDTLAWVTLAQGDMGSVEGLNSAWSDLAGRRSIFAVAAQLWSEGLAAGH
jgi:hypothetical protein